jgi:hypothetical protein
MEDIDMEDIDTDSCNEVESDPYVLLACKVIHRATKDYFAGQSEEVLKFAETDWFFLWSKVAGIDPVNAKEKLTTGNLRKAKLEKGKVCLL